MDPNHFTTQKTETEIDILVRDESIQSFFTDNVIGSKNEFNPREPVNPYYLFKDRLMIKGDKGVRPDQHIRFVVKDRHQGLNKKLEHIYTYQARRYDDISTELVLVDFQINTYPDQN